MYDSDKTTIANSMSPPKATGRHTCTRHMPHATRHTFPRRAFASISTYVPAPAQPSSCIAAH